MVVLKYYKLMMYLSGEDEGNWLKFVDFFSVWVLFIFD